MKIDKQNLNELLDAFIKGHSVHAEILYAAEHSLREKIEIPKELWHKYLNLTRSPGFLINLKDREERYRWAETTFNAVRVSNYSLLDMINDRVNAHPENILFSVFEGNVRNDYSYKLIKYKISKIAGCFYEHFEKPSVALYLDNCIEGALTDIASLSYDIFIAPLHNHFGLENLAHIFKLLKFNIVLTDTPKRVEILEDLKKKIGYDFIILYTGNSTYEHRSGQIENFNSFISSVNEDESEEILDMRNHFSLDDISTVMFTSGSTGIPKIVAFTNYNLLTKRFARGAVFPKIGENEVLLCYLPLFHTFGRFFEMLGMIYWGGNYVFAGKNDFDSLIQLMPKVKPTGLVSIPLRWKQIYEQVQLEAENTIGRQDRKRFLKELTGGHLKWGISAAGFLESKVFKFFNANDVDLCSGFGMTEATGGISMTPPGEYIKDSVGIPLPGVKIGFSDLGELQISGVYVARYLNELDKQKGKEYWMNTGDLFIQDENGYLYIIDRIKDIYKNIKGQTIAPSFIEKKFENIPGLKRAFLVGDMKPYNSLLILPDLDEPFIAKALSQKKLKNYFASLVSEVNRNLHPFERIVKFAIIDRNFSEEKGELTSKGTFKRKVIESNFKNIINELYTKSTLDFDCGRLNIKIPLWALKDLGITENDLKFENNFLRNVNSGTKLLIKRTSPERIRIGNFEYVNGKNEIDIAIFILQPILWVGNVELIHFFLCKEEWDSDFKGISSQIFFDFRKKRSLPADWAGNSSSLNPKLKEINENVIKAIYGSEEQILNSLFEIEKRLYKGEHRINNLLSRRLEILAYHPKFKVRSHAYKILLFSKPDLDYGRYLPTFINSGLPFLNKRMIENFFKDYTEEFNLNAFRRRLEAYRKGLKWPGSLQTVEQFKRIFELLSAFVHENPSSYGAVRVELINWILHKEDPVLSDYAQEVFRTLARWFESRFRLNQYEKSASNWKNKLLFQDTIPKDERKRIQKILINSTFLKEAFMLIFNQQSFDLREVNDKGVFISSILSTKGRYLYRISVNTKNYKHYDLVILIKPDITRKEVLETIYLMIKISGGSGSLSVLPKPGNFRSKLGVISFEFINELTVWERIRMINIEYPVMGKKNYEFELKLLFIRGMAAYFRVLKNSDYKVVPGNFSPSNSVVPEWHFKKGSKIISITGWTVHKYFEKFFSRLYNNFYLQTFANYPLSKDALHINWMFDACIEAFGAKEGLQVLKNLDQDSKEKNSSGFETELSLELLNYLRENSSSPYINSFILSAIKDYKDWLEDNPSASKEAKEKYVNNLYSLYRIDREPEAERYIFYSRTYFSDTSQDVWLLFSKLINSLFNYPEEPADNRIELAQLQEALKDETDKRVFNSFVFPQIATNFELTAAEETEEKELVLKTKITDSFGLNYTIRKPVSAFEIASLQKIFIMDNYPIRIDPDLQYLIIVDDEDEEIVAGGLCYKIKFMNIAQLEGIDISKPYRGRDLGRKLVEDFFSRLKSNNIKLVTTYLYLISFFEKFDFKIDERWGGLAKILD